MNFNNPQQLVESALPIFVAPPKYFLLVIKGMVCSLGGGPTHRLRRLDSRFSGYARSVEQIARFLPDPCAQHMSLRAKRTLRQPKWLRIFLRWEVSHVKGRWGRGMAGWK
eukprot:scaffold10901_cov181-Cylindrotheca_fusiformis.AAC.1